MDDPDSLRVSEHGRGSGMPYKLFAVLLVICIAIYLVLRLRELAAPTVGAGATEGASAASAVAGADPASRPGAAAATSTGEHQLTPQPAKGRDPNDLASYVAPGQAPRMEEVIQRLHDAGVHTGLGAFQPPGTSPPLIGLAVPPDYVLPEGYVRHYQATDDGQRIEPILMYSPDYDFYDAAGRRIEIPANRVVPPELAPPGLPLRPIEIPPPLDPGSVAH